MMESISIEEENIIKDIRNLVRLEKETKAIKDKILRDINILFEHGDKEENYYKPVRVGDSWSNNYIEYESNTDRNKMLSVEEYINKNRPFFKDIINNLKKSGTWKTQLTIENSIIFSIDNDEERVMNQKRINSNHD